MPETGALKQILEQVDLAKKGLDAYAPSGFGWHQRCRNTVTELIPWLVQEAPHLQSYVGRALNSPTLLREAWTALKPQIDSPAEVARLDELFAMENVLLAFIAGDTVSTVVTGHLLAQHPKQTLAGNSKSDYPDIFLTTADYSELLTRAKGEEDFGAAVRGKQRKPIRVPDGLEIKTSRDNARIDCHFAHVGLHLMVSFKTTGDRVIVDDVLAAFLRYENYSITKPKTGATTLKASFSRAPFVSLLPAQN